MIFFRQKCDFYDTSMILLIIFHEKSHYWQLLIYQLDITVLNIKNDTLILFYKKINYTYVWARTIINYGWSQISLNKPNDLIASVI